ncbi:MAG: TraB/GumN family protein [Sphingobacteriales bacterium JAD_PAG50586_3]|nr:MAG: TraB/GumN family protein [Sphingobacteriales bacterium JAD_PAG50586_3]
MKSHFKSLVFSIITLLGIAAPQLQAQEPTKGLLYKISGNGLKKPSYLFGTFHVLRSGYFDDRPLIGNCFEKADKLVVEVELLPGSMFALQDAMSMPDVSVSDFLSTEEIDKLDRKLIRSTGSGIDSYNHTKPAAIMLSLTSAMPVQSKEKFSMYTGEVMDTHLMEKAHDNDKPVISLETVDEQVDVLLGEPIELQLSQLKDYLNLENKDDTSSGKVVDLYFAEDLAGLYQMALDNPDQIGSMDRMLTNRNNKWMQKLPDIMSDASCFIAVGALHLAGPDGLVYQLRKAGYTVTALPVAK